MSAVVLGVANAKSLAWACATALRDRGMRVVVTCQNERMRPGVERLVESSWNVDPTAHVFCCDATIDSEVARLFQHDLPKALGTQLDALVHSIAYAPGAAMRPSEPGRGLVHTTANDFLIAHHASVFSLISVARHGLPLFRPGSSIVALSYLGAALPLMRGV